VRDYQRAIVLRRGPILPIQLAKSILALGRRQSAADEAKIAMALSPSADNQALLTQIEAAPLVRPLIANARAASTQRTGWLPPR